MRYGIWAVIGLMACEDVDVQDNALSDDTTAEQGDAEVYARVRRYASGYAGTVPTTPNHIAAAPGEEGQWTAQYMGSSGASGVTVTQIKYVMIPESIINSWCDGSVAHRVRLLLRPAGYFVFLPPESPSATSSTEWSVAAASTASTTARTVTLSTSVAVPANQAMYLAVEMVGDAATDTGYSCIAAEPFSDGLSHGSAWANNTGPAYGWVWLSTLPLSYDNYELGFLMQATY